MEPTIEVKRIHSPDVEGFRAQFFETHTPAVISGAMEAWKVFDRWSTDYLKKKAGHQKVMVSKAHDGIHFDKKKLVDGRNMPLGEYLDMIDSGEAAEQQYYAAAIPIRFALPEIMDDLDYPPYIDPSQCRSPNLWFGPGQNVVPLHYDNRNNFLAQVKGKKRVLLFPPSELSRLQPFPFFRPTTLTSRVNIAKPDVNRFPRFQEARYAEVWLEPGEILFIPLYWWHGVFGHGINISLNYWINTPAREKIRYPRQFFRGLGTLAVLIPLFLARSLLNRLRPGVKRNGH